VKNWSSSISPSDAVVALRSFSRRWRGLLAQAGEEEDPDGVLRRQPPDGSPSVHDLLAGASAVLAAAEGKLRGILLGSNAGATGGSAGAPGGDVDALAGAAESFAAQVAGVSSDDWERSDDAGASALDVVREAVAEASDNLRQAERTLAQVRGRPAG